MHRRVAVPKKYDHINFVPPEGVANAAAKGLELRAKASPSNRGGLTPAEASKQGIGSGVQRAVNLKNRDPVSPKVVKQMRGFLSRSEKSSKISDEHKGTPWNDKGYVAWLLWGGDPAVSWVDKIIGQMEAADEKEKQSKKAAVQRVLERRASDNEPSNPGLWAKVQALTKGEKASITVNGKTINGPNDGKGFTVFPSAYANGWASKTYKDLGGGWKKKKKASLAEAWGPTLREARGQNPYASDYGGSWTIKFDVGRMEPLLWTPSGFKDSRKLDYTRSSRRPKDFRTQAEANREIQTEVLDFIRDYRSDQADLIRGWGSRTARGKAKKDVGHGGLDEWFSGHGGAKGKGEDATWGDWVSISPVTKTLPSGKKVEKGDIVGECGISDDADWKEITKGGEDPLKCMPRQKAHDMPKKERAEKAKAKQRAEKADSSRGKKPTNTPTFDKKKGKKARGYRQVPTKSLRLDPYVVRFLRQHGGVFKEYPNLWIKGGGARDALINFYADRTKGYQRSSRPLRDIDLVLIGGSHSDRDELLARFGGSVESEDLDTGARSMGGYLRSRDVGINEVALRPDFFVFTDKALRDLSRNTVNPSGGEVDPEWGDVSPRLGLRSVLFSLREGLDLPDNTMVTEAVRAARPFDLLIHLYKAFETGVEDSFFDAVSGNDHLVGARTAEEALLLLHQEVYSFSRTPAQEAIYQDAVMISDLDAWDRGKKARLQRIQMKREAAASLRAAWGKVL